MPHLAQPDDEYFMRLALAQAQKAQALGEVPVGAVMVQQGQVIAVGHNAPISTHDPSAHAEINALRAASQSVGNYRLQDCTLYVTLEPCTMCSGALLHARLKRVVFGAKEPRMGAAGSVHNVFGIQSLNPQTQVQGGVLADECAALMQAFFKARRNPNPSPLREDALRTPESRFEALSSPSQSSHYVSDLPTLNGWRMHYVDQGSHEGLTFLCLHDSAAWSCVYKAASAVWVAAGHRVVAPDLLGFGKSDKPKKASAHSLDLHMRSLQALIQRLDLQRVVLVVPSAQDALGMRLPMTDASRFVGLLSLGESATKTHSQAAPALDAPFPDKGHRAALDVVASFRAAPLPAEVLDFWQHAWRGRRLDLNSSVSTHGAAIAQEAVKFFI